MHARLIQPSDHQQVLKIIRSNPTMYGADVSHDHPVIFSKMVTRFTDEQDKNVWVIEQDDGSISGACIQLFWESLPYWSVASLYMRHHEGRNHFNAVKQGEVLFAQMAAAAEERGIYEAFYVVRDSRDVRLNRSVADPASPYNRYHIFNVQRIAPFEVPKFTAFTKLLGRVAGKNTKPIVFRHAVLKHEFRKSVWS